MADKTVKRAISYHAARAAKWLDMAKRASVANQPSSEGVYRRKVRFHHRMIDQLKTMLREGV
jgi:hypothetical protein